MLLSLLSIPNDSCGRTLKLMPRKGKSKSSEVGQEDSDLTPKQRRRAQVRKAQIEHRQRKENHIKHLEQEVIDLREKIAQAETQSVLFKHENIAIKTTLQDSRITIPSPAPATSSPNNCTDIQIPDNQFQFDFNSQSQSLSNTPEKVQNQHSDFESNMLSGTDEFFNLLSPNSLAWLTNTTLVRTTFDPFLDDECLQISPAGTFPMSIDTGPGIHSSQDINNISLPSPDMFNSEMWKPAVLQHQEREKAQMNGRVDGIAGTGTMSPEEEMEMMAINFILALEHPCRTHFSPPSAVPYDPSSAATGHELMATTHLFSHASSFTHPNPHPHTHPPRTLSPQLHAHSYSQGLQTESIPAGNLHQTIEAPIPGSTWRVPPLDLKGLYEMSESMPKENWEITPVQAWFLLVGRYGWERLVGKGRNGSGSESESPIDEVKRGLAELVSCLGFGSVMDEVEFWGVVGEVLGEGWEE
ncbi:hypothetical protein ONS96_008260 [Cadophora gregata f. sp. sojae]|nr:hypothetical protein ONS96_008260 [Cadophora gregata f. sp. sojae]